MKRWYLIGAAGVTSTTEQLQDVFLCDSELHLLESELKGLIMENGSDEAIGQVVDQIAELRNDPNCYGDKTITLNEHFSDKPSDGSITVEAMEYDGPVGLNLEATEPGNGAGHGESMNHPAVWAHLENLFRGDLSDYGNNQDLVEFLFFKIN